MLNWNMQNIGLISCKLCRLLSKRHRNCRVTRQMHAESFWYVSISDRVLKGRDKMQAQLA